MDKSKRFFKSYRYILTAYSLVTNDLFYYIQKFPNKGEFFEINYIVNSNLGRLKEMGVVVFTELCWFEG